MSLLNLIQRVLSSGLLTPQLVLVPSSGASSANLSQFELPIELADLLAWRNGMDLEVIRIHGVGEVQGGIVPILARDDGALDFASDAAGFRYFLNSDGTVSSLDSDGGLVQQIADDAVSFFHVFVFGSRAAEFAGAEWAADVAEALGSA